MRKAPKRTDENAVDNEAVNDASPPKKTKGRKATATEITTTTVIDGRLPRVAKTKAVEAVEAAKRTAVKKAGTEPKAKPKAESKKVEKTNDVDEEPAPLATKKPSARAAAKKVPIPDTKDEEDGAPKKRGAAKKVEVEATSETAKKPTARGRVKATQAESDNATEEAKPVRSKRGGKATEEKPVEEAPVEAPKKGRGKKTVAPAVVAPEVEEKDEVEAKPAAKGKKTAAPKLPSKKTTTEPAAKKGRGKKVVDPEVVENEPEESNGDEVAEEATNGSKDIETTQAKKVKPAAKKGRGKKLAVAAENADKDDANGDDDDANGISENPESTEVAHNENGLAVADDGKDEANSNGKWDL